MPTYSFRCGSCLDEHDFDFDIGTAPRLIRCEECGGMMQLLIGQGVQIAPSALEGKGAAVRQTLGKDAALDEDMGAYKRMRYRGLQPQKIDGAAQVEDRVGDQFDVEWRDRLTRVAPNEPWDSTKQRVREGLQEAREHPESSEFMRQAASE